MTAPRVGEIMTRDVKTLREDQVLLDAMQFLHQHAVRHVPILDAKGALVGVLTDRDVKRASPSALAPNQREVWEKVVKETSLAKVMTREPLSGAPDMPLKDVLRMFVDEGVGCLPVLDGGRLVGIVTASDLFRAMLTVLG